MNDEWQEACPFNAGFTVHVYFDLICPVIILLFGEFNLFLSCIFNIEIKAHEYNFQEI